VYLPEYIDPGEPEDWDEETEEKDTIDPYGYGEHAFYFLMTSDGCPPLTTIASNHSG
jgi:hypothetical protein